MNLKECREIHDAKLFDKAAGAKYDDLDTAIDYDGDSTSASITSSILQYRTIHGRTYHSEQGNAQYW